MKSAQTNSNTRLIASVGVQCHAGSVRTENQDRVSSASTPLGDLYVVADGVGGYENGAEAAQAVVDGFARELTRNVPLGAHQALQAAAEAINRQVERYGQEKDPPSKMSSTVVLALISGASATIGHVGDSRAYLVRGGKLSQITRDHSVMQRLIDQGAMGPAEARNHANASVLTQALGQSADVEIGIAELPLYPGDAILLCSDGLWSYTSEAEMEAVAASQDLTSSGVANALLHLALQGGGGDNVGLQFLRFSAELASIPVRRRVFQMPARIAFPLATALAVVLVAAAGLSVLNFMRSRKVEPLEQPLAEVIHSPQAMPSEKLPRLPSQATQPTRQSVYLVNDGGFQVTWTPRLKKMENLEVLELQASRECRDLEQDRDTLYFKIAASAAAKRIEKELHLREHNLIELAAGKGSCGPGDLVAVPARRSNFKVIEGAAQRATRTVKDRLGDYVR